MGVGVSVNSSQTKNMITSYTEAINSAVASVYNSSTLQCSPSNDFTIEVGGITLCGETANVSNSTFIGKQVSSAVCSLSASNSSKIEQTFKTTVVNATRDFIENDLQNKGASGWFSIGFQVNTVNVTNTDDIVNKISNSFNSSFENLCSAHITANNKGRILLCGNYNNDTFDIEQTAVITNITSCINKNITAAVANNSVLNQFITETDNYLSNQQSEVATIILYFVIASVLLAIIAAVVTYMKRKGGASQTSDTYSSGGTSRTRGTYSSRSGRTR